MNELWSAAWYNHPMLLLFLLLIIFCGALYQLYSRHINIAGVMSALALCLFIVTQFIDGESNGLAIVLFIIGISLIFAEFFVFGLITGIIGVICVVLSFILMADNVTMISLLLAIVSFVLIIEWVILVKVLKKEMPFFKRLILTDSTNKESGYTSHDDFTYLMNEIGTAHTDLRPSGTMSLHDDRYDVVAESSFIARGSTIKVIKVEGSRIVVRNITESTDSVND